MATGESPFLAAILRPWIRALMRLKVCVVAACSVRLEVTMELADSDVWLAAHFAL